MTASALAAFGCFEGGSPPANATPPEGLDHVGMWSCVLYGNPELGEQRMVFKFTPDGSTAIARTGDESMRAWAPASGWRVTDAGLEFSDPRTGREFLGDLDRSTLGGLWRSRTLAGGWWCSAADEAQPELAEAPAETPWTSALMPPLHPMVMATPNYPREAIRQAKQGRAVVCFMVDAEGSVFAAEVVELSDEIFRTPSLDSLARSRYRGWADANLVRPGCRTFIYRLDAVYR